jgi:hypothetical protein
VFAFVPPVLVVPPLAFVPAALVVPEVDLAPPILDAPPALTAPPEKPVLVVGVATLPPEAYVAPLTLIGEG